jgi:hypothetical protein
MTPNQLILLLQIYRGTEDRETDIGSYPNDLKYLIHQGYVQTNRDRQYVTPLANIWIRDHVLKEPQ